jgi:hypothetical protein
MTTPANPADAQGSRPVPDPTLLTTEGIQREVTHLRELLEAKLSRIEDLCDRDFSSVHDKLRIAEEQRKEQKVDTKEAILAALEAQEKAAQKSENAISKQLEQMGSTFNAGISNLSDGVNDVKDRVTRMEAVKLGVSEQRVEGRTATAGFYAAIGIAVTVVLAVLSVIAFTQGG